MSSTVLGFLARLAVLLQAPIVDSTLVAIRVMAVKFITLPSWILCVAYSVWFICFASTMMKVSASEGWSLLNFSLTYTAFFVVYSWVFVLYLIATTANDQRPLILLVMIASAMMPVMFFAAQGISHLTSEAPMRLLPILEISISRIAHLVSGGLLTLWVLGNVFVQWLIARNVSKSAANGRKEFPECFWVFLLLLYYPIGVFFIRGRVLRVLSLP